jgi:hypothetical protein
MKKYILPCSIILITQSISSFFSTFYYDSKTFVTIMGLVNLMIVFFIFLFFLKKLKKEEFNNEITFSKAFGYSFKLSLLWSFIGIIIFNIYSIFNREAVKNIMERSFAEQRQKIIDTQGSISLSEEKFLRGILESQQNPFLMSIGTFIYLLIAGLVISLIVSAICKSKSKI